MGETIASILNDDELDTLSFLNRELLEKLQKLPTELNVDKERSGEVDE